MASLLGQLCTLPHHQMNCTVPGSRHLGHVTGKAFLASQDLPPVLLGNKMCVSHHRSRVLAAQAHERRQALQPTQKPAIPSEKGRIWMEETTGWWPVWGQPNERGWLPCVPPEASNNKDAMHWGEEHRHVSDSYCGLADLLCVLCSLVILLPQHGGSLF